MKTAILTDIHSNLPALEAVLERCQELGIERYVCLGDTVGYAANPNECADLVRERVALSVLGNHDAVASGRMPAERYYKAARQVLEWTRDELSPANRAWLASLPFTVREGAVEYCHGSPLEPEEFDYIIFENQAAELLNIWNSLAELTFIGHSHLPRMFCLSQEGVSSHPGDELQLEAGKKYLFTVGSVGQPRDGDPRAAFAIHDSKARTVSFHRVEYDISETVRRIEEAELPKQFGQRLFMGA